MTDKLKTKEWMLESSFKDNAEIAEALSWAIKEGDIFFARSLLDLLTKRLGVTEAEWKAFWKPISEAPKGAAHTRQTKDGKTSKDFVPYYVEVIHQGKVYRTYVGIPKDVAIKYFGEAKYLGAV